MSKHAVLFDYDGVLFRNRLAQENVNRASIRYAQKFMNLPFKDVAVINNKNYIKYGHTVKMLQHMNFQSANMDEYNRFVFEDNMDYDEIKKQLTVFDHYNTKDIEDCVYRIEKTGGKCGIFTNSCSLWVNNINRVLDVQGIVSDDMCFTYDKVQALKPSVEAYEFVENSLSDARQILFVEDNQRNLDYCEKNKRWASILVKGNRYVGSTVLAMYANNLRTHS